MNGPLPSSKNPHFQNEARCTTFLVKMSIICMRMKNNFHIKGWALTLVFKQRSGGTRKWPIIGKRIKWVYLEPNKKFFVSPSNFFYVWIFGGWGRLRHQRLRGSRMWTLNYLTIVYDRMRIIRRKVKLLLGNNHELLW